jgi:hypothetical protein
VDEKPKPRLQKPVAIVAKPENRIHE